MATGKKLSFFNLWILICIFGSSTSRDSFGLSGEDKLLFDLFHNRNYSTRTRPVTNVTDSVAVSFSMSITQLIDVDEKSQIITTNVWIYQGWNDSRLCWDPAKYEGLQTIAVPASDIWSPDTSLLNSDDSEFEGYPRIHLAGLNLNIFADGSVLKVSPAILRTPCIMDITYFPVDQQTCEFEFGQWAYLDSQVRLFAGQDNATLENYLRNVEWDIVDSNATAIAKHFQGVDDTFTTILIKMNIKRKPLYYIVNLILPCVVVSLLTVVVFCLPSMSSDKVSLSISLLLTIYVFNILVIDLLPATSLELPLVTVYLIFSMGLIGFSVALTTLVSRIYSKGEASKPVPTWARTLFLGKLAKVLLVKVRLPRVPRNTDAYRALNSEEIAISETIFLRSNQRKKNDGEQFEMNSWTQLDITSNSKTYNGACIAKKKPKVNANSLNRNKKKKAIKVFFICERTNQRILHNLDKLVKHTETLIRHVVPDKKSKQNHDDWVALATVVDRILLVLFLIVGVGGASLILPNIT
ncbi:neuronal acetylcholine receptor subunit alpha-2-like [Ptychodera flava]|uniref:neuronal acetylcholine receptor subunit alpha-2-like n=1 Tax=Ptychodera flava TaxID=63121 RepID=UPI003969CD65